MIANVFELLFKQVLSQIILLDAAAESLRSSPCRCLQELFTHFFNIIFANIHRYLNMTRHFDVEPQRLFDQLSNAQEAFQQETKDLLADDKVFMEEKGGEAKVKLEFERSEAEHELKFNRLCQKVREQEGTGKTDTLTRVFSVVSKKIADLDVAATLQLVKGRDPELKLALKRVSTAELGIEAPSEQEIDRLLRQNNNSSSGDEAFKKRFDHLKSLLVQMNT